jgi:hypothetical protein
MQNQKFGKRHTPFKRVQYALCATFISAAIAAGSMPAHAQNISPQFNKVSSSNVCIQNVNSADLKNLGYKSLKDLKTASLLSYYLEQQGRTQSTASIRAILKASEQTGVDFNLMLIKAMLESDLGKYNQPQHVQGAARGLFQYMPQTWITLLAWHGQKYNNGQYSTLLNHISFDNQTGRYTVNDPAARKDILDLRYDHKISAFIKAMQIKHEEGPVLRTILGHEPSVTEFYVAHVLGLTRAKLFFQKMQNTPDEAAAKLFSREAKYNRFLFYSGGRALSYRQVYERLERIVERRENLVESAQKQALAHNNCIQPIQQPRLYIT